MNARQFRMKQALHTDTSSGLTAAYERGVKLAKEGAGELSLNEAMNRCKTKNSADILKSGYLSELSATYKI